MAYESIVTRLSWGGPCRANSHRARQILEKWTDYRARFIKIFPKEYRRALGELAAGKRKAAA